ncbi:Lrp/AsnC family transcriptional regulator [Saxibacter everestensis]|uniref:Lrp/AsnC family transcriptional regulator n=1 Tax=Saxibacter everestensis TaxID=2909229 RepID=A0ABY8QRG5_9MICO|nr:Lrp/AsnC family transcriptional regulator [Brevibacteriaceae bacterium ZFBP1038]
MLQSTHPDERDIELVDALQLNARASWSVVARVVDASTVTLARRWERLTNDRLAWSSISLTAQASQGAVIELECSHGSEEAIAMLLAERPEVITVGVSTGEFKVHGILLTTDLASIHNALARAIPDDPRILRSRVHAFGSMLGGVLWREGVISPQMTRYVKDDADQLRAATPLLGIEDRAVFLALALDGRRSFTELAASLGKSEYAIKRRINRLSRAGEIGFRCDIARPVFGYPLGAVVQLQVPDDEIASIGSAIGGWKETRFCAEVTSPANLLLIVGVRSMEHLQTVFRRVRTRYPSASILDRRLITRQVKVYGRILDQLGRCERAIPVDPWAGSDGWSVPVDRGRPDKNERPPPSPGFPEYGRSSSS